MNYDNIVKDMISSIKLMIKKEIGKARFDSTVRGRVIESLGSGKYKVLINGKEYTVKSHFSHAINDVVEIIKCNGSWSDLYVLY